MTFRAASRVFTTIAALFLGSLVVIGIQAPANAAACEDAMNSYNNILEVDDDYGQIAGWDTGDWSSNGNRAEVRVISSANVDCQYISSLHVLSQVGQGFMEFGYFLGFWGPSSCTGVDHDHFYVQPTLFNVRQTEDGAYSCKIFETVSVPNPSYQVLRIDDGDRNGSWISYLNNVSLQGTTGVPLGFTHGAVAVGMERGVEGDIGVARYNDVFDLHLLNWNYTENLVRWCDNDPDYRWQVNNAHEGEIVDYQPNTPWVTCNPPPGL